MTSEKNPRSTMNKLVLPKLCSNFISANLNLILPAAGRTETETKYVKADVFIRATNNDNNENRTHIVILSYLFAHSNLTGCAHVRICSLSQFCVRHTDISREMCVFVQKQRERRDSKRSTHLSAEYTTHGHTATKAARTSNPLRFFVNIE